MFFRTVAIIAEVILLMVVVGGLFSAVVLTTLDFGLDQKYKKFLGLVMTIIGGLALIFFVAHLVAFYPRITH